MEGEMRLILEAPAREACARTRAGQVMNRKDAEIGWTCRKWCTLEGGAATSEARHKKQLEDGKEVGVGEGRTADRGSWDNGSRRDPTEDQKRPSKVMIAHHI